MSLDLGLDFRFETSSNFFLLNYGLHLKNPGLMSPAYTVRKRSQGRKERVGQIGRLRLKYIHYCL